MKILLVGTGGVGEAIARIAKDRPWVQQVVLTDYSRIASRKFRPSSGIRNGSQSSGSMPASRKCIEAGKEV